MNLSRFALVAGILSLPVGFAGCSSSEKPKQAAAAPPPAATTAARPVSRQDTVMVDVTARVKAIDHATRTVTLADADGDEITFVAGPSVQRLSEVRVGDTVAARYRASLLAELRPATEDEKRNPIAKVRTVSRNVDGTPAGLTGDAIRAVTRVEAVDVPNMLVTLRGPMGDLAVVRGRHRENVQQLRPGDTIVLTYTESVAMALDKVAPR